MGDHGGFQGSKTTVIVLSALASAGGAVVALLRVNLGLHAGFLVLVAGMVAGLVVALLIVKLPSQDRYAGEHRAGGRTVGELADTRRGAISQPAWSDSALMQPPPPPSAPPPHPLSTSGTPPPGPTTRLPRSAEPTAPPPPPRNPPMALIPVEPDPAADVYRWGRSTLPTSALYSATPSARPQPSPELADYVDSVHIVQCPHCGDFRVEVRRDETGYAFTCRFDDRHQWQWQPGGPWPTVIARAARHPSDRAR